MYRRGLDLSPCYKVVGSHGMHLKNKASTNVVSTTAKDIVKPCTQVVNFSILDLCSYKDHKLFTLLLREGICSPLISYFADCELKGKKYTTFSSTSVLLKYNLCEQRIAEPAFLTRKGNLFKKGDKCSQLAGVYRLYGGTVSFSWIRNNDPVFFKCIYEAVTRGLCAIRRLDLQADHSEDLLSLLNEDVRLGRVNTFKSHLRGSGICNNIAFNNQPLGSRSSTSKLLRGFSGFRVDTLCCGEVRANSCVLTFARKNKETTCTYKHEQNHEGALIKLSFFPQRSHANSIRLATLLFYTTTLEKHDQRGQHVRDIIFAGLLFSRVVFCRKVSTKSTSHFNLNAWSPWYSKLFKSYMYVLYCTQETENVPVFAFSEKNVLPLLGKLRFDFAILIKICNKMLFKEHS